MTIDDKIWKNADIVQSYLSQNIWSETPFAAEQLMMLMRVIQSAKPDLKNVLDIGCGDGILGQVVLNEYPHISGVLLDFSEPMLDVAKQKLADDSDRVGFVMQDYGQTGWIDSLQAYAPFDVIISGYSIHHQPDEKKQEIYTDIFELLAPGGLFLNIEHVEPATALVEEWFNQLMIDTRVAYQQEKDNNISKEEISELYRNREEGHANILAPVETQCQWLREIGFDHVDCYFKVFELALFGGIRPTD